MQKNPFIFALKLTCIQLNRKDEITSCICRMIDTSQTSPACREKMLDPPGRAANWRIAPPQKRTKSGGRISLYLPKKVGNPYRIDYKTIHIEQAERRIR
jgi:hypothetical protein